MSKTKACQIVLNRLDPQSLVTKCDVCYLPPPEGVASDYLKKHGRWMVCAECWADPETRTLKSIALPPFAYHSLEERVVNALIVRARARKKAERMEARVALAKIAIEAGLLPRGYVLPRVEKLTA